MLDDSFIHSFNDDAANCNQVFMTANPKWFTQEFEDFMTNLNGKLRNLPHVSLWFVQFLLKEKFNLFRNKTTAHIAVGEKESVY